MIFKCTSSIPNFTVGKSYISINEMASVAIPWTQYLFLNDKGYNQWAYATSFISMNDWRKKQLELLEI